MDEDLFRKAAEAAYDKWIAGDAGLAFAGDSDVREGFIDGYLACANGYDA